MPILIVVAARAREVREYIKNANIYSSYKLKKRESWQLLNNTASPVKDRFVILATVRRDRKYYSTKPPNRVSSA